VGGELRGCCCRCCRREAYVSIRQHTSAYVIRSAPRLLLQVLQARSIRQHTSAYAIRIRSAPRLLLQVLQARGSQITPAYVSIRQHTSAYVIRGCCCRCCKRKTAGCPLPIEGHMRRRDICGHMRTHVSAYLRTYATHALPQVQEVQ
jgi:hypothetical protein